jgi:hypothetical protein
VVVCSYGKAANLEGLLCAFSLVLSWVFLCLGFHRSDVCSHKLFRLGFYIVWIVLHRNGYAFSAKAFSYFIVYSCVALSFARMTKAGYLPVFHVSPYNLRVAGQNVKWNFGL